MTLGEIASLKELTIKPGSVFRMTFYPADGVQPKNPEDSSRNKYFVILGISEDLLLIGTVLINSEINQNLAKKISKSQWHLKSEDYDFLNGKDRYLDCYRILKVEYNRILQCAEFVGVLLERDLEWAIQLVNESPVTTTHDLQRFGINFRS